MKLLFSSRINKNHYSSINLIKIIKNIVPDTTCVTMIPVIAVPFLGLCYIIWIRWSVFLKELNSTGQKKKKNKK